MNLNYTWYFVPALLTFSILLHAFLVSTVVNTSTSVISKRLYNISASTSSLTTITTQHHYSQTIYHSLCDWEYSTWNLINYILRFWLVAECLFYMHNVATHKRLQGTKKPSLPKTDQQREQLFRKCFDTVDDVKTWSVGWFYYHHDMSHPAFNQLYRQNMALWFAWAYWDKHVDDVIGNADWARQMEWMIDTVEEKYKVRFPLGYNDTIECVRQTLDPIQAIHRPLVFYLGIYLSVAIFDTLVLKWWWKFQVYGDYSTVWGGILLRVHQCFLWIYIRLNDQQDRLQQCKKKKTASSIPTSDSLSYEKPTKRHQIVYWYRPMTAPHQGFPQNVTTSHNSNNRNYGRDTTTPVVFIHGIGAGPSFYSTFIGNLITLNRPLFVVEMPFATMRMVKDAPESHDTAIAIKSMLQDHGYKHAVFVSHSFGTAVTTWLKNTVPCVVAGAVMIDPVCFLLNHAHVCFNFSYRRPKRLFQYLIFYFAARELYIIHYFSRLFQWQESIYFVDPPTATKTTLTHATDNTMVFLSQKDGVTDSAMVEKYLIKGGMDHTIMPGLEHGEFMISWTWRKQILDHVDRVARNVDDEGVEL